MNSKIRTKKVDWSDIYATTTQPLWKVSPHDYTIKAAGLRSGSYALDIGCGEGHDALYLAKEGCITTAIDVSEDAINVLQKQARLMNLNVSCQVCDAISLNLRTSYDVIVSYGFLHFAGKNQYVEYIENLKSHTNDGGVHAFYTFGDVGNFHDIAQHKYWFPSRDSLSALYQDWIVHKLDERTIKTLIKGDKGEDLYNSLLKILVQKPL